MKEITGHIIVPITETSAPVLTDNELSWNQLEYAIEQKKGWKTLLSGISGSVRSGQVVAIMGGSGKILDETLINRCGQINTTQLSGRSYWTRSITGSSQSQWKRS
jgi:ABC-type glutathione transport system ATPase component